MDGWGMRARERASDSAPTPTTHYCIWLKMSGYVRGTMHVCGQVPFPFLGVSPSSQKQSCCSWGVGGRRGESERARQRHTERATERGRETETESKRESERARTRSRETDRKSERERDRSIDRQTDR
jgi:hypothetical protein